MHRAPRFPYAGFAPSRARPRTRTHIRRLEDGLGLCAFRMMVSSLCLVPARGKGKGCPRPVRVRVRHPDRHRHRPPPSCAPTVPSASPPTPPAASRPPPAARRCRCRRRRRRRRRCSPPPMPVPMPPAAVAVLPRRRAAVARVTRLATSATTLRVGNSLSPLNCLGRSSPSSPPRRRWAPPSGQGHRQPLPPCRRAAVAPVGCGVYTSKRPRSPASMPASQMHPYSIFVDRDRGVQCAQDIGHSVL